MTLPRENSRLTPCPSPRAPCTHGRETGEGSSWNRPPPCPPRWTPARNFSAGWSMPIRSPKIRKPGGSANSGWPNCGATAWCGRPSTSAPAPAASGREPRRPWTPCGLISTRTKFRPTWSRPAASDFAPWNRSSISNCPAAHGFRSSRSRPRRCRTCWTKSLPAGCPRR